MCCWCAEMCCPEMSPDSSPFKVRGISDPVWLNWGNGVHLNSVKTWISRQWCRSGDMSSGVVQRLVLSGVVGQLVVLTRFDLTDLNGWVDCLDGLCLVCVVGVLADRCWLAWTSCSLRLTGMWLLLRCPEMSWARLFQTLNWLRANSIRIVVDWSWVKCRFCGSVLLLILLTAPFCYDHFWNRMHRPRQVLE